MEDMDFYDYDEEGDDEEGEQEGRRWRGRSPTSGTMPSLALIVTLVRRHNKS